MNEKRIFEIVQGPQGITFKASLSARQLVRLLAGVLEDVREKAIQEATADANRVQVVSPLSGIKLQ